MRIITNLKIVIPILCFIPVWLNGQPTAMFEATIWFEDAVGNRDSIVVGYDTLATEDIDPAFGEAEITSPFDSVFEVRAGALDYFYRFKLSKKIIGRPAKIHFGSDKGCYIDRSMFIYVWAKHQPVEIWWSRPVFNDAYCNRGSLISNHWTDELASPYDWDEFPQEAYWCMAIEDSLVIDLSEPVYLGITVDFPVEIEKEVEGLGVQTIYGMRYVSWSPHYSPCLTHLSADTTPSGAIGNYLSLAPNPAEGAVRLITDRLQDLRLVHIYDLQGRLVRSFPNPVADELDISGLATGIYLVEAVGKDGGRYIQKLVKL